MKPISGILSSIMLFGALGLMSTSCTKTDGPENETVIAGSATFVVDSPAHSSTSLNLSFDNSWFASNSTGWFILSPLSGDAGVTSVTVTTQQENPNLEERLANFSIISGQNTEYYAVVQRGRKDVVASVGEITVGPAVSSAEFYIDATEEFTLGCDADWVSITSTSSDPVLLMDGRTYSDSLRTFVSLEFDSGINDNRSAEITVTPASGATFTIPVSKIANQTPDFTKTFYRRSVFYKFTGTWCVNCPTMAQSLNDGMKKRPERIAPMNIYNDSNGFVYSGSSTFESTYSISGFPQGIFNSYAKIQNWSNTTTLGDNIAKLVDEAVESYPSKTNIAAFSSYSEDGTVSLDIQVAVKEVADNMRVVAFVMEDGVVAYQTGGGANYVHDHITRAAITPGTTGYQMTEAAAGKELKFHYEIDVPTGTNGVKDVNNAYILIYTTYSGGPTVQGVSFPNAITYGNYGTIIDNAAELDLVNGLAVYKYEE